MPSSKQKAGKVVPPEAYRFPIPSLSPRQNFIRGCFAVLGLAWAAWNQKHALPDWLIYLVAGAMGLAIVAALFHVERGIKAAGLGVMVVIREYPVSFGVFSLLIVTFTGSILFPFVRRAAPKLPPTPPTTTVASTPPSPNLTPTAPQGPAAPPTRVCPKSAPAATPKTPVADASKHPQEKNLAIAQKIVAEYAREHGACPSAEYVNEQLRTAHETFTLTKLECPQHSAPGTFTLLDAQGKVDDFSVDKLTVEGSPAPNTQTTFIKIGPLGAGKIHIGPMHVSQFQSIPMPAAPPDASAGDVLSRIEMIDTEMSDWKQKAEKGMPPELAATDYWKQEVPEFHRLFADRLMLLMRQLRKCGNEVNRNVAQAIYDREKDASGAYDVIDLDINELNVMRLNFVENGDDLSKCVNK